MAQRIQPDDEQEPGKTRREAQRRAAFRNQIFGMLMLAAAAVAWWLCHTNPAWIFPRGWWRP